MGRATTVFSIATETFTQLQIFGMEARSSKTTCCFSAIGLFDPWVEGHQSKIHVEGKENAALGSYCSSLKTFVVDASLIQALRTPLLKSNWWATQISSALSGCF